MDVYHQVFLYYGTKLKYVLKSDSKSESMLSGTFRLMMANKTWHIAKTSTNTWISTIRTDGTTSLHLLDL